jgi:DNA (cytosine-5)-methyltransferase 1
MSKFALKLDRDSLGSDRLESFEQVGTNIIRKIRRRDGSSVSSEQPLIDGSSSKSLAEAFDASWLRSEVRPYADSRETIKIVDLFSGCGGISLGFTEACRALGLRAQFAFASEIQDAYLDVYKRNLTPELGSSDPIENWIDGVTGSPLTRNEEEIREKTGRVDVIVAGPPCQGHSDLNNYTRRSDPKNNLYERVARAAEVFSPDHVVIENVPGVRHDKTRVMQRTMEALHRLGYTTDIADVLGSEIGVSQARTRTFLVASRSLQIAHGDLKQHVAELTHPERSVGWAIEDIQDSIGLSTFDETSTLSAESRMRVDWLFDNDEYDLPDRLRPDCHKNKKHTYKSVYGRMYWDRPAQTITTGFQVMGQGRFLHPLQRRVITSHEAARLQFIPDYFKFGERSRKEFSKMIGNAVPPKMAYVIGLFLLR